MRVVDFPAGTTNAQSGPARRHAAERSCSAHLARPHAGRLVRLLPSPPAQLRPVPDFAEPPASGTAAAAAAAALLDVTAGSASQSSGSGAAAAAAGSGGGGGGEVVASEVAHGVWGALLNFERVGTKKEREGERSSGRKGAGLLCPMHRDLSGLASAVLPPDCLRQSDTGGKPPRPRSPSSSELPAPSAPPAPALPAAEPSASTPSAFIVDVLVNAALPPGSSAGGSGGVPRGAPLRLLPPGDKAGTPLVATFSLTQAGRAAAPKVMFTYTCICVYTLHVRCYMYRSRGCTQRPTVQAGRGAACGAVCSAQRACRRPGGVQACGCLAPCQNGLCARFLTCARCAPQVDRLSSVRIYLPKDLRPLDARKASVAALAEALLRLAAGRSGGKDNDKGSGGLAGGGAGREVVPLLDPESDMKVCLVQGRHIDCIDE
jgi:hypothetical protein